MEGKLEPQPAAGDTRKTSAGGAVAPRAAQSPTLTDFVIDDTTYQTTLTRKYRQRTAWRPVDPHLVTAAIPGLILQVNVKIGDRVARGQSLLVLEAMKMQNQICSPAAGAVAAIRVVPGQKVAKGELMVELRD